MLTLKGKSEIEAEQRKMEKKQPKTKEDQSTTK